MSSSEPTEWLSFSGVHEEKITSFVQTLNRRAFEQGKSKDDEWLAQYAAACLSEDALMWYYSLGEEVQYSWKKLCPALLKEFSNKPAAGRAEVMESDIVPAPAPGSAPSWAPIPAAAQAPAASPAPARPPVPSQKQSSTVRVGNIEVFDASSGARLGYLNSKGDKTMTQDINNAVLVELPLTATASTPVSLRMINAVVNDPQSSYAGIMGLEDPLNWWMLVACAPGNKERHLPGALTTVTMSYIWTVHPLGETLELKILNPGRFNWERPTRLYVGQYLPIDTVAKGFINSNTDPSSDDMLCAYDKGDVEGLHGFRKARMVFRPI